MMNDGLMRIGEAAQLIGYKVNAVYQLVHYRQIPFIKLSPKALRFDRAELIAWIESKKSQGRSEGNGQQLKPADTCVESSGD